MSRRLRGRALPPAAAAPTRRGFAARRPGARPPFDAPAARLPALPAGLPPAFLFAAIRRYNSMIIGMIMGRLRVFSNRTTDITSRTCPLSTIQSVMSSSIQ